jgi:hypothetical protein
VAAYLRPIAALRILFFALSRSLLAGVQTGEIVDTRAPRAYGAFDGSAQLQWVRQYTTYDEPSCNSFALRPNARNIQTNSVDSRPSAHVEHLSIIVSERKVMCIFRADDCAQVLA